MTDIWTIDGLFEGRPESRALFDAIRRIIEEFGSVEAIPTKTQVSFGARRKFAWVWLPQTWIKKRPETGITVTFDLDHEVKDSRIAQAVQARPGHWTHHVNVNDESELDEAVRAWLSEAYRAAT